MNHWKDALLKASAKMINKATDKEAKDWPPTCTGIIYQPQRPASDSRQANK